MPYMEHPQIATPPDETPIWRYMDLPKFLLMLEQKSLYFSLLSEFEDKWEAVLDRELTRSIANQFTTASGQIIGSVPGIFSTCRHELLVSRFGRIRGNVGALHEFELWRGDQKHRWQSKKSTDGRKKRCVPRCSHITARRLIIGRSESMLGQP
jgi:hypothetical protein